MSQRLQGPERGRQKPASAGGEGRGRCRGDIMGPQDKVSETGNPRAMLQGIPECSSGESFSNTIGNPELHSAMPCRVALGS
ncbi:unnamed protein product, partial [Staurois parvus]